MLDILNIVFPAFVVISIGYALGKYAKIDISTLVTLSLYLGVPSLTFSSILSQDIVLNDAIKIWVSAIAIMFGCGIFAFLVL